MHRSSMDATEILPLVISDHLTDRKEVEWGHGPAFVDMAMWLPRHWRNNDGLAELTSIETVGEHEACHWLTGNIVLSVLKHGKVK